MHTSYRYINIQRLDTSQIWRVSGCRLRGRAARSLKLLQKSELQLYGADVDLDLESWTVAKDRADGEVDGTRVPKSLLMWIVAASA